MKTTERFEKVDIDKLVPYARNARTHSKEQILQLRASLREFGFVNPVIVDKDLNIIAAMENNGSEGRRLQRSALYIC